MNDGIGIAEWHPPTIHGAGRTAQRIDRLPEIIEIGLEEMAQCLARRRHIDIQNAMTMVHQITDHRLPRLAAAAGDNNAAHGVPHALCSLRHTTAAAVATGGAFVPT